MPDEPSVIDGAASLSLRVLRRTPAEATAIDRETAVEAAVAIEINGLGYAVMMATPHDLVDFGYGFAHSERIVSTPGEIIDVEPFETERGWILRITAAEAAFAPVRDRVRHRVAESGCGLCGLENLEQALKPLPALRTTSNATAEAVFAALEVLREHQPLNAMTGGVHAAALCDDDGRIRLCREDVGRHNAFDKLIGAALRSGTQLDGGFALLTSRCSYELVEKAVLAGVPMLVTVSTATSLAVERARQAGLTLVALARPDAFLVFNKGPATKAG